VAGPSDRGVGFVFAVVWIGKEPGRLLGEGDTSDQHIVTGASFAWPALVPIEATRFCVGPRIPARGVKPKGHCSARRAGIGQTSGGQRDRLRQGGCAVSGRAFTSRADGTEPHERACGRSKEKALAKAARSLGPGPDSGPSSASPRCGATAIQDSDGARPAAGAESAIGRRQQQEAGGVSGKPADIVLELEGQRKDRQRTQKGQRQRRFRRSRWLVGDQGRDPRQRDPCRRQSCSTAAQAECPTGR
jgi:hypothetical protein